MHCTGAGHSGVEWEWGTAIYCNTLKTGLGAGNRAPARHVWITINGKRHRQEYVTTRKRAMRPGIYNEKQHKQLDFELRQLGLTPPSPGAILDTCSWVHLSFFLPRWTYDNFRERNASTVHFLTNSSRMHFVAFVTYLPFQPQLFAAFQFVEHGDRLSQEPEYVTTFEYFEPILK